MDTLSTDEVPTDVNTDDFQTVRRKRKQRRKAVTGCCVKYAGFAGVTKKSVVCVNRLELGTTVEMVTKF
jgi:hypothetical protein